jgi:hypothetical protein
MDSASAFFGIPSPFFLANPVFPLMFADDNCNRGLGLVQARIYNGSNGLDDSN